MDRRSALVTLGAAGLGLFAMQLTPSRAADFSNDALAKLLPDLSPQSRQILSRRLMIAGFSGQIPAEDAAALAAAEHKSVDELMVALLPLARTYSRPPISNYHVGAVARGASGNLYLGANIEFPGHSLGFSVHGEQFALSNAYMHAEAGIESIAVTAAPCGHCRQFIKELSPANDVQIIIAGKSPQNLSSLLTMSFGPQDLGFKDGALPVKTMNLASPKTPTDELVQSAFEAARKSYAPYTKSPSGVAIRTRAGRIYNGSYIENAAFNPSLPPLQAALAALLVAGDSMDAISAVALVELEPAAISQRSGTEAVLSTLAPSVRLLRATTSAT